MESVQTELEAALHELAKRYPRLPIYVEGLTADGVNAYKAKAVALLEVSGDATAQARALREEVRRLKSPKARELERQYTELINGHRAEVAALGAPWRLCLGGEVEVMALDDEKALEQRRCAGRTGSSCPTPRPSPVAATR